MNNGTLGHRESDKLGLSGHIGVLDREAPTSKHQRRWWEYVTAQLKEHEIEIIKKYKKDENNSSE